MSSQAYWEGARANGQRAVDYANRMLGVDEPADIAEAQALLGEVPAGIEFDIVECLRRQLDPCDPAIEDKARYALNAHVEAGRITTEEMAGQLRSMKVPRSLGILGNPDFRSFVQKGLQRPTAHSPYFYTVRARPRT